MEAITDFQTKYLANIEGSTVRSLALSTLAIFALYFLVNLRTKPIAGFELIGKEEGEWTLINAQKRFTFGARKVLEEGVRRCKGSIFQVISHAGPTLIVGAKYIDELKSNPHVDLSAIATTDFFTDYPAFSSFLAASDQSILLKVINKKLTTALNLVTGPVNEENTIAMKELWPETKEWTTTPFFEQAMFLTAQVSSRIFLGAPICRDPVWVQIAKDYTKDLMIAAFAMRFTPAILRPLAYYILPPIHKLQNTVKKATVIIEPEIARRRKARAAAIAAGEKIPKHLDSIDWMDEVGYPEYDFTGGQLNLTFVAVHTTSSTLVCLLYDIIEQPGLIPELREEMIAAMTEDGGLLKTTLIKMKLLDSVMKESQRVNILSKLIMQRRVKEQLKLHDGTIIPKGTRIMINSDQHHDASIYPDPQKFDGKRFLNLRNQPGNANKFQFVTPTSEHVAFGVGQHACPGRFFAANEIKVMICHLLLKYDWQFKGGVRPKNARPDGIELVLDDKAELLYKSRTPEIDLATIKVE